MSEHIVNVAWARESESFDYDQYNREHDWTFDNGQTIRAAAAPAYKGSPECVDPEEAFVASVASCHMLTFLAIASKKGLVVKSYRDRAVGVLAKNEDGRLAITKVTLRPQIEFGAGAGPESDEALHAMHEHAHRGCFIANSVKCEIEVQRAS